MSSTAKKGLVAGAFSLALAGLISKVLGVIYIVPFQNMAGDYVMALYQYAYSIYVVMLQVTTAGIPLAMSKMISERNALHDYAGADHIYRVGARYLAGAGLIIFLFTMLTAGLVATWMGNYNASTAIRTLGFALLIVPLLAAMRGYVQGHQEMALSGNSQVVEQFVRVSMILALVFLATTLGAHPNTIAASAVLGAVLGALASLIFLARKVVHIRRENRKKYRTASTEPNKVVFRRILKYAIPISMTSLVLPLSQLIDSFTITNLLQYGMGMTEEMASSEYGVFTARALRLVALPLALATGVGLSLMPAISEAIAERKPHLRNSRVITSFRLTSFFAFPTMVGIYVLAGPINVAMFEDLRGTDTIQMVALMAIFSSYELVSIYILQALGHMYLPIRYMFTGLGLKLLLNIILVPMYGIYGAAIASVSGYALSSLLNFWAVRRHADIPMSFNELIGKPVVASLLMGVVVYLVTWIPFKVLFPWDRIASLITVMVGGIVGAAMFGLLMVLLKGISQDEMRRLPVVKRFVR